MCNITASALRRRHSDALSLGGWGWIVSNIVYFAHLCVLNVSGAVIRNKSTLSGLSMFGPHCVCQSSIELELPLLTILLGIAVKSGHRPLWRRSPNASILLGLPHLQGAHPHRGTGGFYAFIPIALCNIEPAEYRQIRPGDDHLAYIADAAPLRVFFRDPHRRQR